MESRRTHRLPNLQSAKASLHIEVVSSHLQSREMDHIVNVRMSFEDTIKILLLANINLKELRTFATYALDTVEDLFGRIVEVVRNDDFVASFK